MSHADVTEKMEQLKAARAKRGRIYNSVEEFMAERAMIIDLVMARGEDIKVRAFTFVICPSSARCSDRTKMKMKKTPTQLTVSVLGTITIT